jgi:hypothetical protein
MDMRTVCLLHEASKILQVRCVHHHWWMKNKNPRCLFPRLIIVKISVLHPSDYSSIRSEDPCLLCNDMSPRSIWVGNLWKTRIILYQVTAQFKTYFLHSKYQNQWRSSNWQSLYKVVQHFFKNCLTLCEMAILKNWSKWISKIWMVTNDIGRTRRKWISCSQWS